MGLRGYGVFHPGALVQLLTLVYSLARPGVRPVVELDDDGVLSYLARAGFCATISPVAETCPQVNEAMYRQYRGRNPMLLEVTRIESCDALPKLLDKILAVLNQHLKYPKYDADDIATVISEVTQNTFDHNW